jgi:glucarate dehydratase
MSSSPSTAVDAGRSAWGQAHIRDLRVRTCSIPIEAPTRHSYASPGYYSRTIVELISTETCDGQPVIGLGETYGVIGASAFDPMRPFLIGADPFDLQRILLQIRQRGYISRQPMLASPIEFACLDLQGKLIGRPVYELLGGKVRDRVDMAAYLFYRYGNAERGIAPVSTPEEMVAFAQNLVSRYGFRTIKLKGGVMGPAIEVATMRALREAFPEGEYALRYDPNATFSPATGITVGHQLAGVSLEYYEDPSWGIVGMAQVRSKVPQPLATNMCVIEFEHLPSALAQKAFDVVLSDPWYYGGCLITKHLDYIAPHFGLAVGMHSGVEFGLGLAHMLHCAAAMPNLVHAIDSHYHHLTDDLLSERLTYEEGAMRPPEGPGWGVQLDEDKMARYEEVCRALRSGKLQHAHASEDYYTYPPDPMRPGWTPRVPAW